MDEKGMRHPDLSTENVLYHAETEEVRVVDLEGMEAWERAEQVPLMRVKEEVEVAWRGSVGVGCYC
jgi:hypothetical protein